LPLYRPTPESSTNYIANGLLIGRRLAALPLPAQIVYLGEWNLRGDVAYTSPSQNLAQPPGNYGFTLWAVDNLVHGEGQNRLFADGHAQYKPLWAMRTGDYGLVPGDISAVGQAAFNHQPYTAAF
jgi:prepilin-type processing-associated H-X9-DG protein